MTQTKNAVNPHVVSGERNDHKSPGEIAREINARNRKERRAVAGAPMPGPRTTTPRRIVKAAVLVALEAGPASAEEIEQRMGFTYVKQRGKAGSSINEFLRIHERRGLVKRLGVLPALGRRIIWALVEKSP